jgi:opacity protein-like surface antigen
MKMKGLRTVFCAVAIFGTASVAMAGAYGEAEQAEEMPRSAPAVAEVAQSEEFSPFPYISVGGVYGYEQFQKDAHQINRTYGWGVNARAGFRFHEMIAVELMYEDVIEFDADSGDQSGRPNRERNIDRSVWSLMANAKVYPIQGFAEPYVLVGAGLVRADDGYANEVNRDFAGGSHGFQPDLDQGTVDDGFGFGMRFGLGADFYATDNLFITPEVAYVLPLTSNVNNYNYISASLAIGWAFN